MELKTYFAQDASGNIMPGATVTVYEAGTATLATGLQDESGSPLANPFTADSSAKVAFYAPDGLYDITVVGNGRTVTIRAQFVSVDGASVLRTDLAATGGSALVGYQQAGAGAVARTAQSKLRDVVSVLDFGASPSGTAAVNTASIQAAADYCETTGAFLQGAPGAYSTNGTIVLNCSGDLSAMTLNVDATVVSTAVRVGPNAAGQYLFDVNLQLPFVNNTAKTGAGWAGFDTSIGVHIANVYQSRITVPSVYNFGIGLKEGGFGVGCVYNTITIGVLYGNKVSQLLQAGDTNGWSNQNTHIGGRFAHASAEGSAVAGTAHIKLRDFAIGGSNAPNTNLWLNPSIEGNEPEFHVDIQGSYNTIISPRLELTGGVPARINFHAETANETVGNQFFGGYKAGITYTYSGAGTSNANGYIGGRGGNTFDVSGSGYNVRNVSGNAIGAPHFQGFPATVDALNKTEAATDWTYRIFGEGFAVKATGNTVAKVSMDSSGYVFFGPGTSALAGGLRWNASAPGITSNVAFAPDADNTLTLGTATRRWSVVYAGNATINTSDAREKQQIRDLSDAERAVAARCKALIKTFKFNDAVESKGDCARTHFGVMAQDVAEAFAAEGLDAAKYSMFCYDEWQALPEVLDENGEVTQEYRAAGSRYGIRYEELLAFIIAAL